MDVPRLLSVFPAYIEEHRLAHPRCIPFLVRWVEDYLRTPCDPTLKPDDRLHAFLDQLQHRQNVKDWQVRQAEDSVRMFRQLAESARATGMGVSPIIGDVGQESGMPAGYFSMTWPPVTGMAWPVS